MAHWKLWLVAAACSAACVETSVANAASAAENAAAEELFDEGLRLMKSGSFTEACPKLEASQKIDAAVGTLLYLAECYEKVGRTASAWATFREAQSLAQTFGQADRAKMAQARASRLEPELARLVIEVSPQARQIPGLSVRRASIPVGVELSGVPVPVDPGDIAVEASAPGYTSFSTHVVVSPHSRAQVTIPALVAQPAGAEPPQPTTSPVLSTSQPAPVSHADERGAPILTRTERSAPVLPLVLGGVGVVGLGVGTYFGLRAISNASDARDSCPGGQCTSQHGETLMNDARDQATVSNIAFIAGGAALVAGAVLYIATPGHDSEMQAAPLLGPSTAGVLIRGSL